MEGIRWVKSSKMENYYGECCSYIAKVGYFELVCRPRVEYIRQKAHVIGWQCDIYAGNKWLSGGLHQESLKSCQKNAERLIIQYLFGYGLVVLRELKKMGLLDELLSEVGIDL